MNTDFNSKTKEAALAALKKSEEYLLRRLDELKIDKTVAYEIPKRIYKMEFTDRIDYFEYYLDHGTANEKLLFCEVCTVEIDPKTENVYLVQHLNETEIRPQDVKKQFQ